MPTKLLRAAVEILAVALAYYGAARFALLLAIPPGYATAIWPSAGIALAALLFRGAHVAPGIFLGSFLANLGTSVDTVGADAMLRSLLLPMWIGMGATAQGIAGAALIRRYVGFPTELVEARDTIKLLLLGGPVSCSVSATVGALSLLLTQTLPLHSYAVHWGIWWVGDTIGALIVMPLALAWFGEPRTVWRRRSKIVALPLCIAFLATVGMFIGARGEFHAGGNTLLSWAVLAGGLGLTGMLGAFLLVISGQAMVAERLVAERQITERRLDLAIKLAQLGTWEWELATNAVFWSPSFKLQLGYEDRELSSSYAEWEARLHPEDRQRVLDQLKHYFGQAASDYAFEYRLRHRNGAYRWFQTRALPERGADGKVTRLIGIHLDVTEHKITEQRTREAALHDSLTGLPGRTLVLEYAGHLLASARRSGRSLALLFIDLDRFKAINDRYGHEIGDHLLMEVARRLLACVRAEDLVGRLGGDEFVIVLPTVSEGNRAEVVAQHLIDDIGRPFAIDSQILSVSPSIGISQFPADGDDIDTLIHAADMAMYRVKQSGRAGYQFGSPGAYRRRGCDRLQ